MKLLKQKIMEENNSFKTLISRSQITLSTVQNNMEGEAEKAGFETEEDVVAYIKELRNL